MAERSMPPVATVVIPARNAADLIGEQLAALQRQREVGPLEILVVDNGSTDDTVAVVESWRDRLPGLRVVREPRPGASRARNTGIEAAVTDAILLCDADDVVEPDWARWMLAALADADAVAGHSRWVDADLRFLHDDEPFGPRLGFLPSLSTACAAVRRPVWRAVGRFDESFATSEDLEFGWRLQLAGHRLVREDRAVVLYRQRKDARSAFRQAHQNGRTAVQLYERYRSRGMPRSSTVLALKVWVRLALDGMVVWTRPAAVRTEWLRTFGRRSGRMAGSVRGRTLYL